MKASSPDLFPADTQGRGGCSRLLSKQGSPHTDPAGALSLDVAFLCCYLPQKPQRSEKL